MKLGGYSVTIDFDHVDPKLYELITGTEPFSLPSIVASIVEGGQPGFDLGSPSEVMTACIGWLHQDEDAHEGCSLTACLNPLHPGPCKGWKGTLFKTSEGAYHALEAARVEKANATRLKKIQALKDAGKPIPKKLLTPIVAKPHPHAGKTANAATGEAHHAGQAVSDAAGVHVNAPGKVTLGEAVKQIKATDATPEKGPKGKKPTVASKGIAAVIAQEKVTPQYKLDKAAKITPEQWNALSGDEKSIIRGELAKIQKDGFGPQQKKATELLDQLPAQGLKGGGTDTVTTPKGQVVQKISLKEIENGPEPKAPSPVKAPEEPKAGAGSLAQANAIKNITEAIHGPQTKTSVQDVAKKVDVMKSGGKTIDEHPAFGGIVGKLASAAAMKAQDQSPGQKVPGVDVFYKDIAEHIKTGGTFLPPSIAKLHAHDQASKVMKTVKEGIEEAAKTAHEAKAAAPAGTTHVTPSGLVKHIQKHGSATITHGGITHKVAFENGPDDHAKLIQVTGIGSGTGHYVLKPPGGQSIHLGKGEQITLHEPAPKLGTITTPKGHTYQKVELKPEAPKIENAAQSAPEKPAAPAAHVQHAIDMANGTAPGASWSKHHLAAYQKLTPEEFAALPPDVQSKIIQELKKGATKFLDPKKIQATSDLLKSFKVGLENAPKPKVEAPAEPGFHSHLSDHSVTDAQAKKLAAGQPIAAHAAVAKDAAGLSLADQPDVMAHHTAAQQYAQDLVTSYTKNEPPAALKDPAVKQEMENVAASAYALKQAQLIGIAKKNAFNKIDMTLKGDTGKLSPIQKASLAQYQQYLLNHPTDTSPEQIVKLQHDVLDATGHLADKLKAAKAPKAEDMTPAQLDSRVGELLGVEATKPQVNLSMAELKEANATGKAMAHLGTEKYSKETLENPEVAAKMKQVELVAGQLAATGENSKKLQEHLKKYHFKALNAHAAGNGTLTDADVKVIKAHAAQLKQDHAYLDTVIKQQQDKLIAARKAFDEVANKVQNAPHEPVTLSDYDVATISDAYGNNWGKQASKAVLYGVKTWDQKSEMKAHPEYQSFTQDLGNLQQAVKEVALAHAKLHTASLNVPTDPDTGAKLPGPEKTAYLQAAVALDDVQQAYEKLHKVAQAKLDKIRTDVGLKKRALPKVDSPAVKAAAAESAYYKTGGYSGPNYGKQAAAKSYTLAKVGPKLGMKHQSASEKKAEKAAAEAEKLKAAHPEFYAKKEADKAKAKSSAPSVADAGKTPNQEAADKFGFQYVPKTGPVVGDWSYSSGPAYYANEDHFKQSQDILSSPDVQHGLGAQKQFKWSINNMESKGGSHAAKSSLYSYTGSGYDTVNTKLNSLPPGVEKTGSATITNIDNGMAASPPLEADVVLYRGFKSPHTVFSGGKWNDTNVAGMEWSQRSYSSTSGQLSTAQGFAGYGGVVMRIIVPKGMKVHGINAKGGQHGGENEIILQRGLRYRVVADYGKQGSDGKRYIDVMVVPSPYAKAE